MPGAAGCAGVPTRSAAREGETFDARQTDPEEVAAALGVLSFDTGTRYLLVDDVVAWKAGQLGPLEDALKALPPETVLVLIARGKAVKQLSKAVERRRRGASTAPKAWQPAEMVRRARARARPSARSGRGEGARGPRRAESTAALRELEKIGLALHPSMNVTLADVEELAASDNAPQVYDLADALVAGDLRETLRWQRSSSPTASAPAGSCSRSCGACARCTAPPRCSSQGCPSRR